MGAGVAGRVRAVGGPRAAADRQPLPSPFHVTSSKQCRDLSPETRLQIRARGSEPTVGAVECQAVSISQAPLEISDAEIRFTGPASVVGPLRDVLVRAEAPAFLAFVGDRYCSYATSDTAAALP